LTVSASIGQFQFRSAELPQPDKQTGANEMKRDMDLIRDILRSIEARPEQSANCTVEIPGRSLDDLRLHLRLMEDAGLVQGVSITSSSASCIRLTYTGYDFLEASRKDTIWQKAKAIAIEKTGGLSLAALTKALEIVVSSAMSGTFPAT
jgi:hypothetical protein